jgi:hypothetical protein
MKLVYVEQVQGLFFVTKTITPWSSTMTITNGRLVDNYAPK